MSLLTALLSSVRMVELPPPELQAGVGSQERQGPFQAAGPLPAPSLPISLAEAVLPLLPCAVASSVTPSRRVPEARLCVGWSHSPQEMRAACALAWSSLPVARGADPGAVNRTCCRQVAKAASSVETVGPPRRPIVPAPTPPRDGTSPPLLVGCCAPAVGRVRAENRTGLGLYEGRVGSSSFLL